ncbi:uncharacterized protein B0I36DRAFT_350693 [Microdochium trichocladiopsis]|uniref:VOC domain-containing protein n=1 Tax=Microdochium trichocladiopsis TaxID=1682393 RepID=A0A9P8Y5E6_9PEZI|nr:uncharacterized protein B0I36DRAFT_350693 [Microdochium trichocladiopsis]KAH7029897.1 hypothetical protein B0I36DRAFT_350693 [Microdochium trichocladiopsis]
MSTLMIYGAAGYTGGMVAEHAASAGLNLVLAGREKDRVKLEALADRMGAVVKLFPLDEPGAIVANLAGISVLLNAAGPFANTAEPLMSAAIRAGVHYLDFSAELDTYHGALALDAQARAAGVMLLPGSGGSVAMLGSLAGHAVARVKNARKIAIALDFAGTMSRGSAISASQNIAPETFRLVGGELVTRDANELRNFDFGTGPQSSFPVTLPDLLTIHQATGVPDIETFVHVATGTFPTSDIQDLPDGPSFEEREASRYHASVEVTGGDGTVARSVLDTVNGYTFTSMVAAEAARRVLAGEMRPGFQTPAGLFGNGFAETIAGTCIVDREKKPMLIDHIEIPVTDVEATLDFYKTALKPLGISCVISVPPERSAKSHPRHGLGQDGYPSLWLRGGRTSKDPLHIAFGASERSTVDAFYAAAMAAGGRDNGPPGVRTRYHPTYYAAYVMDPDDNNVEVVCQH